MAMRRWGQAALGLGSVVIGCGSASADPPGEASSGRGTSESAAEGTAGTSGSDSSGDATTSTGSTSSGSDTTGTMPIDGPPVVVDIGQSQVRITAGEVVVLTAFVSHPLGDDAVVSGQLWGPGEPPQYGEFQRVGPGRWSIELGYDDTESRGPLEYGEFLDVEFTARFEDVRGRDAERVVSVRHDCDVPTSYSCEGVCTNISISNQHCGGCGIACQEQSVLGATAVLGDCFEMACTPSWSGCVDAAGSTCDDVCAQEGRTCARGGCAGGTVLQENEGSTCEPDRVDGVSAIGAACGQILEAGRHRCCCDPPSLD